MADDNDRGRVARLVSGDPDSDHVERLGENGDDDETHRWRVSAIDMEAVAAAGFSVTFTVSATFDAV